MKNKTCGQCSWFCEKGNRCKLHNNQYIFGDRSACNNFKQQPMTNGDKIRQMSDEELVAFFITRDASYCVPEKGGCPDDCGECKDHWLRWLNAPAESEVEDE